MKILNKIIFVFDNVLMTISSIFLFISAGLAFVNAMMRSTGLGRGGFLWSDELTVILVVIMVFLTQPLLEYTGSQLSIGILDSVRMSDRLKTALEIVRGVIIVVVIGWLAYHCLDTIERSMRFSILTPVLRMPRSMLYGFMFASFVLIVINRVIKIISILAQFGIRVNKTSGIADETGKNSADKANVDDREGTV